MPTAQEALKHVVISDVAPTGYVTSPGRRRLCRVEQADWNNGGVIVRPELPNYTPLAALLDGRFKLTQDTPVVDELARKRLVPVVGSAGNGPALFVGDANNRG